jgi:hypothetical protein
MSDNARALKSDFLPDFVRRSWTAVRHFYRIRPLPGTDGGIRPVEGKAISFNDLIKELIVDWRVLATGIAGCLILSILLVVFSGQSYEATLRIAPSNSAFDGSSPTSTGQSVLSLFAGKSSSTYDDFAEFLGLVHSVRLAKRLDVKYDLMRQVFPYDRKTQQYIPPTGFLPWLSRFGRSALGLPAWEPPNYVDLANYLTGAIKIDQAADGTTSLTYSDATPNAASQFLTRVFAQTDELMREEKLTSHRNRRKYVADRLKNTATLEQRNFLMGLWGREESQILVLTSGDPIGARMVDDIHVPNMPQTGAAKKIGIGILFGLLLGLGAFVVRSAIRRA